MFPSLLSGTLARERIHVTESVPQIALCMANILENARKSGRFGFLKQVQEVSRVCSRSAYLSTVKSSSPAWNCEIRASWLAATVGGPR